MTMHDELATTDALGQAALVRAGEVTALELVDAAIERIERVNPRLNAAIATCYEEAREQARRPLPDSPLAGVPFLVKDIGAPMAGMPETMGSRALRDHRPAADGLLVRRYRDVGLIIVGRTNTPEFGNHSTTEPVLFGPTRNPWNLALTTGGSSGGSAAAVASGMVPAAHGSDGAGSLRIPASCCGVFGFKPTRGRVSRAPAGEEIGGLDVRARDHAIGARQRRHPRRDRRSRAWRSLRRPAVRPAVRGRGRPRPGPAADRLERHAADRRTASTPTASRQSAKSRGCCRPRSRRRGGRPRSSTARCSSSRWLTVWAYVQR